MAYRANGPQVRNLRLIDFLQRLNYEGMNVISLPYRFSFSSVNQLLWLLPGKAVSSEMTVSTRTLVERRS